MQVGEGRVQLCWGEKQRIDIARAMLKNPSIMVLDGDTNALDVESQNIIEDALGKVYIWHTKVVVAHQLYYSGSS